MPEKEPVVQRVLVMPGQFVLHEMNSGGIVERLLNKEEEVGKQFVTSVRELFKDNRQVSFVPFESLSSEDQIKMENHRALFSTMTAHFVDIKYGDRKVFTSERTQFFEGMGDGLATTGQVYDFDTVIYGVGFDQVRTGGRIFLDLVNSVLPGVTSYGASNSYLLLGIVEAKTGNVIGFDGVVETRKSLMNEADMDSMAKEAATDLLRLTERNPEINIDAEAQPTTP